MRITPEAPKTLLKSSAVKECELHFWEPEIIMGEPWLHLYVKKKGAVVHKEVKSDFFSYNHFILPSDPLLNPEKQLTFRGLLDFCNSSGPYYASDEMFLERTQGNPPTVGIFLSYINAVGGGNRQLLRHAQIMRECGAKVSFYGTASQSPEWLSSSGFEFRSVINRASFWKENTDDVILVSSVMDLAGISLLADSKRRRVVHLCQGIETYHHGSSPTELYGEKVLFDLFHSIQVGRISIDSRITKYFQDRFSQDSWLIPNRISSSFLAPMPPKNQNPTLKILWVGYPPSYLKGFNTLIEALNEISDKSITLTIASPQPLPPEGVETPKNIETSIWIDSTVENMRALYQSNDLLCCTSIYEGFGLPVVEALACGLKVITTDAVSIADWIRETKAGIVYSPCDSKALRDAILDCFDAPFTGNGKEISDYFLSDAPDQLAREVYNEIFAVDKVHKKKTFYSQKPKFSILMPTYNQAHYIKESIDSVLSQTIDDFELIVCNDGSTDNTLEVLAQFTDPRVKVVNKENGGTGSALNAALRAAQGDWICWLSSDDLYERNALEIFSSAISENPEFKAFHSHYYFLRDETKTRESPPPQEWALNTPKELQVLKLLEGNFLNGITICINREIFSRVGPFNERNKTAQDYEKWLEIAQATPWYYIKARTAVTRLHDAVGAVAFPEAGIYDSSLAAIRFLNKNPFEAIFPHLNLQEPQNAVTAIQESIKLGLALESYIYRAIGPVPVFLERLLEWYSKPDQAPLRQGLQESMMELKNTILSLQIPEIIKSVYRAICDGGIPGFVYSPRDPVELFLRNLDSVQDPNEREKLKRYGVKVGILQRS